MSDNINYKGLLKRGWTRRMVCEYLVPENKTGRQPRLKDMSWCESDIAKIEQMGKVKAELEKAAKNRELSKPYSKLQQQMIRHNEEIIEDNIFFGEKQVYRGEATEEEVLEYMNEAAAELKEFKRFLRQGGNPVFDKKTELWRIPD